MIPNKRDLKAFVRLDGSLRTIPSSLILRKNKPKVGNWVEVQAYDCCTPTPTTYSNICVDGFVENDGFNGTYIYVGISQDKPHYEKDGELYDVYWDGSKWMVGDIAYSPEDVANPTLVVLWVHSPEDGDISVTEGECL